MKHKSFLSWLLILTLLLGLGGCAGSSVVSNRPAAPPEYSAAAAAPGAYDGSGLRVDFLDVGQADCALLRCGGDAMLIDGGNVADSSFVVAYLKAQGVEHLNYLVASHAHEDHAGGLSGPLNTVSVAHVYCPVTEADGKYFSDFQTYTAAQGLSIEVPQVGDTWPLGDATVTVLGPVRDYEDANDASLVLAVDYGATSFLFTGDMGRAAEGDLLASGAELQADVLKVGHHGSGASSTSAFLDAVDAQYGVISVGADNVYGHPSPDALERLQNYGVILRRTDEAGTITCISDGTTLRFSSEKNVPVPPHPPSRRSVVISAT